VASLVEADLLINLTDLDGLYDADPRESPQASLVAEVGEVDRALLDSAGDGGPMGTGGMLTKVRAAGRLAERGVPSLIANGRVRGVLERLLAGEVLGTFFRPSIKKRRRAKQYWLAFAARPKGRLLVDPGAAEALSRRGKSLLPGGITSVEGLFDAGDPVTLADARDGTGLGVGLANYSAPEIRQIMGRPSSKIESIQGYSHSDEVVHRDNLAIFEKKS
jgi:glutamate 5-kinase